MKRFETLSTWLIVIGLLLFSGIASLTWIALSNQTAGGGPNFDINNLLRFGGSEAVAEEELITIQLEQYLLGEVLVETPGLKRLDGVQVHPLLLAGILTAFIVGGLVAAGLPLALIYVRLDRQTEAIKGDPEFQAKQAELEKREQERLRELAKAQPPDPIPSHQMPRWAVASTSLIILFFVILVGYALADTFYQEGVIQLANGALLNPAVPIVLALSLLTLLLLVVAYRRQRLVVDNVEAENGPIPWGMIWVVVTGLIFIGIGTGLMLAIRSAGGG